jgi:hypothetical protein
LDELEAAVRACSRRLCLRPACVCCSACLHAECCLVIMQAYTDERLALSVRDTVPSADGGQHSPQLAARPDGDAAERARVGRVAMALRQQGRHACWEAQVSADTLAWHSQHAWRTSDHACAHHRHHPAAHTSSATHRRQGVSTRRCGRVRRRPASSTSRGHRVDRATRCRLPTMSPPRHGSCCRGCTPPSRYVWRAPSAPALSSPISPATRPLCGPPPPQTACLGPCVRAAYLHHVVTTRPSGFAYRALMQVEVSREKRAVQVPLEPAPPPPARMRTSV